MVHVAATRSVSVHNPSFPASQILLYLHPTHQREREHTMTFIQQFIEKAFVGGWQPLDRDFRIIGFYERYFEYQPLSTLPGRSSAIRVMVYEAALLNPKVWQAVGRVEQIGRASCRERV